MKNDDELRLIATRRFAISKAVECFNPETDDWEQITALADQIAKFIEDGTVMASMGKTG